MELQSTLVTVVYGSASEKNAAMSGRLAVKLTEMLHDMWRGKSSLDEKFSDIIADTLKMMDHTQKVIT